MQDRKKYQIYLLVVLTAACIAYLVFAPEKIRPRDYPEIAREGILRFVVDYSPLSYCVDNDTITGFEYELAVLVGKESGLTTEICPETSLAGSLEGLASHRYDVVARAIPVTTAEREKYLFSCPLIRSKQVLVQRAEGAAGKGPVRNQLELAGCTLYIPADSPAALRILNLSHEIGDTLLICEEPLYSDEQLVMMVARGEIGFAVCDGNVVASVASRYPEIDYSTDIGFTQFGSWAVRNDAPALADSLNVWLKRIRERGDLDAIKEKYYGEEQNG